MRNETSKSWVEISSSALASNVRELKRLAGDTALMAVVKSNAYGHGIRQTVRAVCRQADWFGVDSLGEAETVKEAESKKPILILGFTPHQSLGSVVKKGFSQVVYGRQTVDLLNRHATKRRPAKIHVKVETGTSRQGINVEDLPSFLRHVSRQPNLTVEGLSTHFANVEDTVDSTYAFLQLKRFKEAARIVERLGKRPPILHVACSAAAIIYPETHFDLVRTGISLYGLWSSKITKGAAADRGIDILLKPALTWKTMVAQVKKLRAGTPVSYGLTEKVRRDSIVAVVPIGYWDGFDRGQSSIGNVLIHGSRAKVLGRVCMNMTVVDVTDIRCVKEEDEVVLIGKQGKEEISAEEFADRINTVNYEAVTRINPLLPRIKT
ncbi:alanine racemase [Candidatus Uhrbacteria bacterium CG_4_10_14_0_8_um_filter_58_22]|uniref:Alanine racemase n=1 Tax=Candidatus Uhrbacteria bacterium CG_4_10_14_0_8_um_filter_58_22 TaxID=1975029 RepID=A0A2M7QAQ8_9BACT|nr:MAG: alanine racemase [Parcubacteria group bacterium CG1_02_58_44]PIY62582.1 MAG: alanine racemase [Candidatus Uhrbacteria bacterium CG_4_10_14_0_8_um_filter_58_22]